MSSFEVKKESISRGAVDFIQKPLAFEQMNTVLEKIEDVVKKGTNKVLIVEDNSHHAKALGYFLETHGVATRQLKSDPQTSQIPVIYFSANTNVQQLSEEATADDYLQKPFNIDDLERIVEKYTKVPN